MRVFSKVLTAILVVCLICSAVPATTAWADEEVTADTPMPNLAELQLQVDEASATYDDANQRIIELENKITALDERIATIQSELPQARQHSNDAAREYYLMLSTSSPYLEMILGATSLNDFFAQVEYTTRINESYLDEIASLSKLNTELEEARAELDAEKATIKEEQLRSEEALVDAQQAREIAEETARLIAEATAVATAEAAAAAEASALAEAHVPETPLGVSSPGAAETPSDKQAYINLWAPRIDAYLAGSPMAGCGNAFANAAFDYNVDPRWSPAIACMESSKGRYLNVGTYNAWGWGYVSWPDWETAIYSHVRGLSIGYGSTISEAAAQKYCPPNWEHWYSVISNQMNLI